MYSDSFLTMCPRCKTVKASPRIHLHLEVTCMGCSSRFTAEENYLDIEEDAEDAFVPHAAPVEDTPLPIKDLEEGMITNVADRGVLSDFEERISFGMEEHYKAKPLEWRLERIESIGADKEAFSDTARPDNFETSDHHEEKPFGVTVFRRADAVMSRKELGFCSDERKMVQRGPKPKKRKHSQNPQCGIALRKPSREKQKVKCRSPSRESLLREKEKLELDEDSRVKKHVHTSIKRYRREVEEVKDQVHERNRRDSFIDGDVSKGEIVTEGMSGMPTNLNSEEYFEELKKFLTVEISRQVLEGLGEASRKTIGEIQVVEVEGLFPLTPDSALNIRDATSEEKRFVAKVRLMATVSFPVTLCGKEGCPTGFPNGAKGTHNSDDESKGREATEDEPKDMKVPEPIGLSDAEFLSIKPSFRDGYEPKDLKLPEPMETMAKPSDEPVFQDGCEEADDHRLKDMREHDSIGLTETENPADEPWCGGVYEEVDVPESEFYDFECNKSEDSFAPGQVWASYDSGKDMMPRDYVQIKKVVSTQPFKVHIALLQPAGLSCGEFSIEKGVREMHQIDGFSHLMSCENGRNGLIYIYPAEMEVWALYKNWQKARPYEFGYEIVQVVGVKEDLTVTVIPLVNDRGSSTVFKKKETEEPFQIHKHDLARFSHQIPMYEIVCDGVNGRLELDPAAIPSC